MGYWRYSLIAVEVMYYEILYTCRGLELRHRVQSGYDCSCTGTAAIAIAEVEVGGWYGGMFWPV